MKQEEIRELIDITHEIVWNMCNEIACSNCHYNKHSHSVKDCPIRKLSDFADKVQRKESESKVCKSCNNCSHVRYAYQTKEPYCIERGVYVNEKTTTCDKFNSLDMITTPKESEETK